MIKTYILIEENDILEEIRINENNRLIKTSDTSSTGIILRKSSNVIYDYNQNGLYLNLINNFPSKWYMILVPLIEKIEKLSITLSMSKKKILPQSSYVFNFMKYIDPTEVRVIIIGQDPYPTNDISNGIAFSTSRYNNVPPSLHNIYEELNREGYEIRDDKSDFYLSGWLKQGVLLLNTSLTVCEGNTINGHQQHWFPILSSICLHMKDRIVILFGKKASIFKSIFSSENTFMTSHPSPNSASNGFIGSHIFNKVNTRLEELNINRIDWGNC